MLKNQIESRAVRLPLMILTAIVFASIHGGIAAAQFGSINSSKDDDSSVRVSGEIDAYVEWYDTNFAGDYNGDTRGDSAWAGAFGNGLPDTYSQTQTRLRELELHFRRTTSWGDSGWRIHSEVELEFKPRTHSRDPNRLDVEEASVTFFKNEGGMYFQMGFLEDMKLYEGGNTDETTSEDAKGYDEEPSIRFGFYDGTNLDVDVRYHSIVRADAVGVDRNLDGDTSDSGETLTKEINQTAIRLQVEYKVKDSFEALLSYTMVDSVNKEDAVFQNQVAAFETAGTAAEIIADYEDSGLVSAQVIGAGVVFFLGDIWPVLNYEQRHVENNKGDDGFDISVIELGVMLANLGPGNLWLGGELGNSDISGEDVAFTQLSGEYHFIVGRSKFGPGFKYFSNDAEEALKGTIVYFGGEWRF